MPIRTIETVVNIEEDRRLIIQLPADVPLGQHRVVAVLDDAAESAAPPTEPPAAPWTFPVLHEAQWPDDMPLKREEMYDDNGG